MTKSRGEIKVVKRITNENFKEKYSSCVRVFPLLARGKMSIESVLNFECFGFVNRLRVDRFFYIIQCKVARWDHLWMNKVMFFLEF